MPSQAFLTRIKPHWGSAKPRCPAHEKSRRLDCFEWKQDWNRLSLSSALREDFLQALLSLHFCETGFVHLTLYCQVHLVIETVIPIIPRQSQSQRMTSLTLETRCDLFCRGRICMIFSLTGTLQMVLPCTKSRYCFFLSELRLSK